MERSVEKTSRKPVRKPGADGAEHLLAEVYDDLRGLAQRFLGQHGRRHTLQPTALVHEAYLRLARYGHPAGIDRRGFYNLVAKAMRFVLIDHARRRDTQKRRATGHQVGLDDVVASYEERAIDLVALDDALARLETVDPRLTRVIELRFFCGTTLEETAEIMGLSARTVRREVSAAKVWLRHEISRGHDDGSEAVGER